MTRAQQRPIRVFAGGMNEKMINTLRFFFQGPFNNHCVLVEEDSADLGIIDLDEYQGRKHMQAYRERHPEQPIILLSLQNEKVEDAIHLRKPLKPERLMSALKQAQTKVLPPADVAYEKAPAPKLLATPLGKNQAPETATTCSARLTTHKAAMVLDEQEAHTFIGSAPDLELNDLSQLAKAQYDPDLFLQAYLRKAVNTADRYACAVKLKIPYGVIAVLPNSNSVFVNISDSRLHAFCSVPMIEGALSVKIIRKRLTINKAKNVRVMSRESLLWKATIWASRGRLPVGTSLRQPVFLRRWPNMTRLMLFPHAMRIAALWAEQPCSLLDTAKMLGIPQRFVFSFYSATKALGLAIVVNRHATDSIVEPVAMKSNKRRGLLGRILNRLHAF